MTDELRRRLRQSVGTDAVAPVEEIVARGRARRRHRRQLVATSGLAALAIMSVVVVLSRAGPTQLHVVGPSSSGTPTPTSTGVPAGTPPCPATALSAAATWEDTGGPVAGRVVFTNLGRAACYLRGQPTVQLVDELGQPLSVTEFPVTAVVTSPDVPVALAPGSRADFVLLHWFTWCAPAPKSVAMNIVLPAGAGSVPVTPPVGRVPTCGSPQHPSASTIYVGNIMTPEAGNVGALALAPSQAPGPTSTMPPSPTALSPLAQREVAISTALLRYQIGKLRAGDAAQPTPIPSPSVLPYYVEDHFSTYTPNSQSPVQSAGPIPLAVQAGIVQALAPIPVVFVPNPEAVTLPSCAIGGAGFVFRLGVIPAPGDEVHVYLGVGITAGSSDDVYGLVRSGQTWTVTGTIGNGSKVLGGCG